MLESRNLLPFFIFLLRKLNPAVCLANYKVTNIMPGGIQKNRLSKSFPLDQLNPVHLS